MDTLISNEVLFFLFLFGGLSIAFAAGYLGKIYVYAVVLTIIIYMNIAEPKVIEVFGLPTTLGTALYGVTFFTTDFLHEHYGRKAVYEITTLSIIASVLFHVFMQLTLLAQVVPDMEWFAQPLNTVFTTSLRIVISSLVVFALVQRFDVFLYRRLYQWTGGKHLWLRNKGSTVLSQALDSYTFAFLAFYGVLDNWMELATIGYGFKLLVAVSDTAFMYGGRMFTPRDLIGLPKAARTDHSPLPTHEAAAQSRFS